MASLLWACLRVWLLLAVASSLARTQEGIVIVTVESSPSVAPAASPPPVLLNSTASSPSPSPPPSSQPTNPANATTDASSAPTDATPPSSTPDSGTSQTETPTSKPTTAPPSQVITEAPSSAEPSKTTPTSAGGTAASPGDSSGAATMPTQAGTGSTSEEEKPSEEEEVTIAPEEHENMLSMSIFFIFGLLGICIILVHFLIKYKFHYLPESIAFVIIGFVIGLIIFIINKTANKEFSYSEKFYPESFFLLLLPPIIFESGYSLHKGNFFQNLGSIILFAVFGTVISACIVGGGLFGLGYLGVVYKLDFIQSFTFGSLISAVDPVATLAIFKALNVNPTLNMLVFGESVLNDAVSIVLTKTITAQANSSESPGSVLGHSLGKFLLMFFGSALIGILTAVSSALFLKHMNLRRNNSLEFAIWFIFAFGPYFLAEGLHLSGIMAVLFSGIVMSQYTHSNLSAVTQVTVQQTLRAISFMAETVVFLYIGMQVFTIYTSFKVGLIIWSLILILIGRAANIFPLAFLANRFRTVKISPRMQFIMWFSGLRGAIAYALALNLGDSSAEVFTRDVVNALNTATLIIVLFTIVILGGSTQPLLHFLSKTSGADELTLSKTEDQGAAPIPASPEENLPPLHQLSGRKQWFLTLDYKYFRPFLIRRFTKEEVRAGRGDMQRHTNEWYKNLREVSTEEEEEEEEDGGREMERGARRRDRDSSSASSVSVFVVGGRTSPIYRNS